MAIKELKDNISSLSSSATLLKILDENLIFSKTDTKGIITFASSGFCKISGYSQDELIGHSHNILRSPNMPKEMFEDLWETIESGEIWHGEVQNKTKSGEFYWVDATIVCEKDDTGNITGYNAVRENITDRKKLIEFNLTLKQQIKVEVEKSLAKDKQLFQQTKSAQMGEMMDAIAHQWKQPLTIISLLSQVLDYKIDCGMAFDSGEIKKSNNEINTQVNHLLETMETFRKFFRIDEVSELITIDELLHNTEDIMTSILISNIIEMETIGDLSISIECIQSEFIHIFINLINNAKDEFISHNIKNRKMIFEVSKTEDGKCCIEVTDNAGGIPEHIIGNIFNSNFTTKEKGKGTGIGLYMTTQILQKINGTISVANVDGKYGRGACFKIVI